MRSRFLHGALATALVVASASASSAAPHPTADRVYHCPLIARAQDLEPLGTNSMPSINAYGQVAFATGQVEDPFESEIRIGYGDEIGGGIFRARFDLGGSLAPTPLVETSLLGEALPDARGSRAYAVQLDIGNYPNIESRLYLRTQQVDSVPSGIGLISGLSVASNVFGMVSYGHFDGAGFEVRVWAGTPLLYVDSDDDALVASNSAVRDIPTSINDYGEVALVARDGAEAARPRWC